MPTTSYWLDDEPPLRPAAVTVRDPEVIVVGGGVTGCSCALALAERGVRVRLHEAREIAGGASGRNGGFALRGAATPYDVARDALGHEPARRADGADRAFRRSAGGACRRRLSPGRQPQAGVRRRRARRAPPRVRRAARGRLRRRVGGRAAGAARPPVRRRAAASARRRHPPGPVGAAPRGARAVRRGRAARRRARRARPAPRTDAIVVAADGFTSSLLPELAAAVRPTRGQVLATEPLAELRYLRPHYARGGYDYWHQRPDGRLVIGGEPRRGARGGADGRGGDDADGAGTDRAAGDEPRRRNAADHAPLGRDLGDDAGSAAARRPCAGAGRGLDRRRVLRARQRARTGLRRARGAGDRRRAACRAGAVRPGSRRSARCRADSSRRAGTRKLSAHAQPTRQA